MKICLNISALLLLFLSSVTVNAAIISPIDYVTEGNGLVGTAEPGTIAPKVQDEALWAQNILNLELYE